MESFHFKVAGCSLTENELHHRYFPMTFAKFFRTAASQFLKPVETYPPPLSLNTFFSEPNRLIQCFRSIFMTKFRSF